MSDPETPEEPEPAPLLVLRDGLTSVIDTREAYLEAVAAFAQAEGPVALDAERASGYRYSARAYLIQARREGAGTALFDPIAFDSMAELAEAIAGSEWIIHAATQDITCLAEVGLVATQIFDTELAGRLLGYPRVGLATLVESILGKSMRKEHSSVDWSTRPLPGPWLEYAALDVEVLIELRAALKDELEAQGKTEWARQEFEHLLGFTPTKREEPWRRTSGLHKVRSRHALASVRELWLTRDAIAAERDVTPGRILPDSALIAAALSAPTDRGSLLRTKGFIGRGASRYAARWLNALATARDTPEEDLPARSPRLDGPPVPRAWADKDPVAAARLAHAKEAMLALSEEHRVPVENLLTPDYLRRVLWRPPTAREPAALTAAIRTELARLSARPWQIDLTADLVAAAVLAGDQPPAEPTQAGQTPAAE